MREDWYTRRRRKLDSVDAAEASGEVADSMEVRKALIEKMHAGEMTLDEVQAALKRIKRNARKNGQITRVQAYRRGQCTAPENTKWTNTRRDTPTIVVMKRCWSLSPKPSWTPATTPIIGASERQTTPSRQCRAERLAAADPISFRRASDARTPRSSGDQMTDDFCGCLP